MGRPKGLYSNLIVVCMAASGVMAAEVIRESDALRTFLSQSPLVRSVSLAVQSQEAESRQLTRLANPRIALEIEEADRVRDEFLTIEQELALTGRRQLLRQRGAAASAAVGRRAQRELQLAAYSVKLGFYEVLYRDRQLQRLLVAVADLERTVNMLVERERLGEGAGYEVLRAEQELESLRIAVIQTEASGDQARARFGAMFPAQLRMAAAALEGEIATPAAGPAAERAIELALAQRLDLQGIADQVTQHDWERRVARRSRFPEPTVTAGWKRVRAPGATESGFVVGLSIALPVFDRGQSESTLAGARRETQILRGQLLEQDVRGEVLAAATRAAATRLTAESFDSGIVARARELLGIAEQAYAEGERGILELLDAQRTSVDVDLQALAARYAAMTAAIELQRAIGSEVTP